MANIYDVAKKAGVSIATVSRYFNNGYVSQDSGERIKEAIDELGYSVSQVAAAMMTKSLKAIGLILPSITNQFFPELAKAVEERAHQNGYTLFVCNSEGSEAKETGFINMLKSLHADGIITATGNCASVYKQKKIPVVSIDRSLEGDFVHVTSWNSKGGALGVSHLYSKGCRRIAFVRPPVDYPSLVQRQNGLLQEADRLHISLRILTAAEIEGGAGAANRDAEEEARLLEGMKDCDGVFAWNDVTAVQMMRLLYDHGIRIPDDIRIMGFDDIYLSRAVIPSLSTIHQQIGEMGHAAAGALLSILTGQSPVEKEIVLEVKLVERETTK